MINTVRTRLFAIALLPFVVFAVAGTLVYNISARPFIVNEYGAEIVSSLNFKAEYVETWLRDRMTEVRFLAGSEAARSLDPARMLDEGRRFSAMFADFRSAVFADTSGQVLADSRSATGSGGNVADREYFQEALQGRQYVSELITARTSGEQFLIFSTPIREAGEILGVAFAAVNLDTLTRLVVGVTPTDAMFTRLLDQEAEVIVATDEWEHSHENEALSIPPPGAGVRIHDDSDGMPYIGASRTILDQRWVLIVEAPLSAALDIFRTYNQSVFLSLLVAVILFVILALILTRGIEEPIHRLDLMSGAVARGDYEQASTVTMPRTAPMDLKRLHDAMEDMARLVTERLAVLEQVSLTDSLTSLANRRHLESEGRRILTMCTLASAPCSVMIIDIDHFKQINDTHGHDVGDAVLVRLSRKLSRLLRAGDFLARYGGEEFVALLPRTDCHAALDLAARICKRIAETDLAIEEVREAVTISIGVTAIDLPESVEELDRTLDGEDRRVALINKATRRADEALYQAKHAGRNRARGTC